MENNDWRIVVDKYEKHRNELDELIKKKNFDMSDIAVVNKSLELENLMFGYTEKQKAVV